MLTYRFWLLWCFHNVNGTISGWGLTHNHTVWPWLDKGKASMWTALVDAARRIVASILGWTPVQTRPPKENNSIRPGESIILIDAATHSWNKLLLSTIADAIYNEKQKQKPDGQRCLEGRSSGNLSVSTIQGRSTASIGNILTSNTAFGHVPYPSQIRMLRFFTVCKPQAASVHSVHFEWQSGRKM